MQPTRLFRCNRFAVYKRRRTRACKSTESVVARLVRQQRRQRRRSLRVTVGARALRDHVEWQKRDRNACKQQCERLSEHVNFDSSSRSPLSSFFSRLHTNKPAAYFCASSIPLLFFVLFCLALDSTHQHSSSSSLLHHEEKLARARRRPPSPPRLSSSPLLAPPLINHHVAFLSDLHLAGGRTKQKAREIKRVVLRRSAPSKKAESSSSRKLNFGRLLAATIMRRSARSHEAAIEFSVASKSRAHFVRIYAGDMLRWRGGECELKL